MKTLSSLVTKRSQNQRAADPRLDEVTLHWNLSTHVPLLPQVSTPSMSKQRHLPLYTRQVILTAHPTRITPRLRSHPCMMSLTHSTIQSLHDHGMRCSPRGGYQLVSPRFYPFISPPSLRLSGLCLRSRFSCALALRPSHPLRTTRSISRCSTPNPSATLSMPPSSMT
jgi:hypothetical protein